MCAVTIDAGSASIMNLIAATLHRIRISFRKSRRWERLGRVIQKRLALSNDYRQWHNTPTAAHSIAAGGIKISTALTSSSPWRRVPLAFVRRVAETVGRVSEKRARKAGCSHNNSSWASWEIRLFFSRWGKKEEEKDGRGLSRKTHSFTGKVDVVTRGSWGRTWCLFSHTNYRPDGHSSK